MNHLEVADISIRWLALWKVAFLGCDCVISNPWPEINARQP
jgi:hypothetical protein